MLCGSCMSGVRRVSRTTAGSMRSASSSGCMPRSMRNWMRQAEIDGGKRDRTHDRGSQRMVELERENRELRRANEILKTAAAFFGAELDRRPKR